MPRAPEASRAVRGIRGSVYSSLVHRLATHRGETYPLHVGDTWKRPPDEALVERLAYEANPGLNRYTEPRGLPALLDALVERTRARTGLRVEREDVLVTGGATAGLGAVVGSIVDPGDEVLLLAPHWPLVDGIVRAASGVPIPVPFFGFVTDPGEAEGAVERLRSERTVALYLNAPNNPTGRALDPETFARLAAWARRHDLWLLLDEVYEDLQYRGAPVAGPALAPERTVAIHSFSKAWGMAGYRVGWVAGPRAIVTEALKLHTHSTYSAATASQLAALAVLRGGDAWIRATREEYRAAGDAAAARLRLDAPEGSAFLFLDAAPALGAGGLLGFLEGCADDGLLAAPGPSFGPFPTHLRVCFTAAPPDVVARGVDILATRLGR